MKTEIGYIYTLNCPITGTPKYVGQTFNSVKKRYSSHINVFNKTKKSSWIKSLLNRNLQPTIDIIDCVKKDDLNFWEMHYISLYNSWGFNLKNSTFGGDGKTTITDQYRKNLSESHKGKKLTQEQKNKISLRLKGNKHRLGCKLSDEHKKRISEAAKIIVHKKGSESSLFGIKRTQDVINKIKETKSKSGAFKGDCFCGKKGYALGFCSKHYQWQRIELKK